MSNQIDISFVVAVYNVELYIRECLESLIALKQDRYEIIVIDDGSTDKSGMICDEFLKKDQRIRVIHQKNQGVSVARNVGINAAKGRWICFVDGDDYILPEGIEKNIVDRLEEKCDIIYFAYKQIIGKELVAREIPGAPEGSFVKNPIDMKELRYSILNPDYKAVRRFKGIYFLSSPWGKVYNNDFLKKNSLYFRKNIIRSQDCLFNVEAAGYVDKVAFLPYEGYVYRRNMNSITNKYTPDMVEHCMILIEQYEELLKNIEDPILIRTYSEWKVKQLYNLLKSVFCNPNNPASYRERKREFKRVRSCPEFVKSFNYTVLNDFKVNRRIIVFCMKKNFFWILNFYFRNTGTVQFMQKVMYKIGLE